MVFFQRLAFLAFLALSASAAPTNGTGEVTIDDIINAPYNPPPLADPAFAPIVAAGNETFVEGNPAAQSKIDNVASVLSSITAAAPTATDSIGAPVPTIVKAKVRRGGGPSSPPPVPIYVRLNLPSLISIC